MVRKAVIPAAGLGTRFLPASKSQPKEMLPIVDKPVIQYVVEEAAAAGLRDVLMIIGKGKRAIEEHFDRNFELEEALAARGREAELEAIRRISTIARLHFVWQRELKGLGDAITYARDHVEDEPFAVLLGDTLIESELPVMGEMLRLFERFGRSVVALEEVPIAKVHRYGVIAGEEIEPGLFRIGDLVEKPDPDRAPSNLAIAGRYVLTPDVFVHLERTPPGKNNEIQLTDALRRMAQEQPIYGLRFNGARYDIGNRLDFLRTNILFALRRPDLRQDLVVWLQNLAATLPAPAGPAAPVEAEELRPE
ncbi:MAG: UTP--glucose-1-phosphate uridylyltransferase GalU [Kiritimatiellae bacterium]|nr:UTP--glucose-1-phosphate uridylyltransferase GalU [Kiritimatiellia bacterium]